MPIHQPVSATCLPLFSSAKGESHASRELRADSGEGKSASVDGRSFGGNTWRRLSLYMPAWQEEGWVVCRAFKKRTTNGQSNNKNIEGWDSSYFYDETSNVSSVVDQIEFISRQTGQNINLPQNFLCKQETEADNLHFNIHSEQFVQLPQLESPSLPLIKRPSSISLVSENTINNNHEEEDHQQINRMCNNSSKKVTDWRALDKND
ncbi:hypothetical protein CCACVL1_26066 [Corchorus capsularis]|uniref:NAC domain-containing protein n=1 Tax=Corchorus capsularis TaxID=210143 RepID=A0A1R3GG28_COCAP|nr:hypothetical protein CCACVL1_26066 [Corchorus capsularis]